MVCKIIFRNGLRGRSRGFLLKLNQDGIHFLVPTNQDRGPFQRHITPPFHLLTRPQSQSQTFCSNVLHRSDSQKVFMNLSIFSNIWHYDLWGGCQAEVEGTEWNDDGWFSLRSGVWWIDSCSQTPTQGENSRIKIWIFWRWNESSAIESRPISHKTKDKVYLKISPRGGRLEHFSKGHTFDDSSWMRKIFDLIVAQIWSYSPQLRLVRVELMCQRPLLFQHVFHLSQLAHSCQHSNKRH